MVSFLIGKFISFSFTYYRYLYVKKISKDSEDHEYKCIDGNHRLAVFKEHEVQSYPCIVLPETLSNVEYFIIANGKFIIFISYTLYD